MIGGSALARGSIGMLFHSFVSNRVREYIAVSTSPALGDLDRIPIENECRHDSLPRLIVGRS